MDDGLDIGSGAPRELARVTLVLTEAGCTFENASTADLNTLLYLCETGTHGIKQVMFQNAQKMKDAMSGRGIVPAGAAALNGLRRGARRN